MTTHYFYEILDARGRWVADTPSRQEAILVSRKIGGTWSRVQS
jgi:hypothetical protein